MIKRLFFYPEMWLMNLFYCVIISGVISIVDNIMGLFLGYGILYQILLYIFPLCYLFINLIVYFYQMNKKNWGNILIKIIFTIIIVTGIISLTFVYSTFFFYRDL